MDFARRNRYLKKYDKDNGDTDKIVLSKILEDLGNEMNLKIHVMHEDIFNAMHRI